MDTPFEVLCRSLLAFGAVSEIEESEQESHEFQHSGGLMSASLILDNGECVVTVTYEEHLDTGVSIVMELPMTAMVSDEELAGRAADLLYMATQPATGWCFGLVGGMRIGLVTQLDVEAAGDALEAILFDELMTGIAFATEFRAFAQSVGLPVDLAQDPQLVALHERSTPLAPTPDEESVAGGAAAPVEMLGGEDMAAFRSRRMAVSPGTIFQGGYPSSTLGGISPVIVANRRMAMAGVDIGVALPNRRMAMAGVDIGVALPNRRMAMAGVDVGGGVANRRMAAAGGDIGVALPNRRMAMAGVDVGGGVANRRMAVAGGDIGVALPNRRMAMAGVGMGGGVANRRMAVAGGDIGVALPNRRMAMAGVGVGGGAANRRMAVAGDGVGLPNRRMAMAGSGLANRRMALNPSMSRSSQDSDDPNDAPDGAGGDEA
ncbi:hypothetical protein ACUN9Y_18635 [Halomonas sp. V046]|uniref:hypothetical protein n=1 Tax=Halomonas sp. V046 TaxID=3459611 RepID=UPI0040440AB1